MEADSFQLDLEDNTPKKQVISPSPPVNHETKYSAPGPSAPGLATGTVQAARPRARRLIAEDPEKRRIVGRIALNPAQGKADASAEAVEQSAMEPTTAAPSKPPVFEGNGLAEVGTLRSRHQTADDDEFSYAFEGGRREEGFHKQVFRPKAMPAHLVSNVKQPLNTEVLAEEEEEELEEEDEEGEQEGDEAEEDEDDEQQDQPERAGERDEGQDGEGRKNRLRESVAREEPSRSGAGPPGLPPAGRRLQPQSNGSTQPMSLARPDGGAGGGAAALASGSSSLASGARSGSSTQTAGAAVKGSLLRAPSDGCGSVVGGISERSRSGGEDLDIMRLSTGHKDQKANSWTTFAVSEGHMESLVDAAECAAAVEAEAGAETGATAERRGINAVSEPPTEDLPSYKLMQALSVGATAGTGLSAENALGATADGTSSRSRLGLDNETFAAAASPNDKQPVVRSPLHHHRPGGEQEPPAGLSPLAPRRPSPLGSPDKAVTAVRPDVAEPPSPPALVLAAAAEPAAAAARTAAAGGVACDLATAVGAAQVVDDEWAAANVERLREMGVAPQAAGMASGFPIARAATMSTNLLTYHVALVHFMAMDTSKLRISVTAAMPPPPGFVSRLLCLGPPALHPPKLREQLLQLLSLARLSFSDEDSMHFRLLGAIYATYTGKGFEPPRYGSHWAELGFQGQDPATDLRGCGMLGLLQLYYLTQWSAASADKILRLSHHPVQEFPLAIVSINVTKWTLQALRCGLLHRASNSQGSVVEAAQQFYAGCMATFYTTWLRGQKTMAQSGHVLKDLEALAMKKPNLILAAAQRVDLPDPPPA